MGQCRPLIEAALIATLKLNWMGNGWTEKQEQPTGATHIQICIYLQHTHQLNIKCFALFSFQFQFFTFAKRSVYYSKKCVHFCEGQAKGQLHDVEWQQVVWQQLMERAHVRFVLKQREIFTRTCQRKLHSTRLMCSKAWVCILVRQLANLPTYHLAELPPTNATVKTF